MDYSDIGLNDQLQPLNSIPAQSNNYVTGYDVGSNYERNSITDFQIRNLNFSKGQGGTLTLGGTGNGEGVLEILNSSGGTVIKGNNTGIEVFNGNITIANTSGSTVLDPAGLVSSFNFPNNTNIDQSTHTTTNSSYQNLANGTLSPLVVTRNTTLMMFMVLDGYNVDFIYNGNSGEARVYDESTSSAVSFSDTLFTGTFSPDNTFSTIQIATQRVCNFLPVVATAGTHIYKMQFRAANGGTATVTYFSLGYIQLGN